MHIDVVYSIIALVVGIIAFLCRFFLLRSITDRTYKEKVVKNAQDESKPYCA